jgi:osmotically-inducible protein OsmY
LTDESQHGTLRTQKSKIEDENMPATRQALSIPTAIVLLLALIGLSGCATAVMGVGTAAVAASTTQKGLSTSFGDATIHTKLTEQFVKSDFSLVTAVDITVNDGAVLMTGKIKTPEEKVLATKLAWEVHGVREVVNELQITDKLSIKDIAKDLAASATLRGKLITDKEISSLNFSIDVVNGTIYLSGVAADQDEMNSVVAHARKVRFTKQVVNYIILQTDKRL